MQPPIHPDRRSAGGRRRRPATPLALRLSGLLACALAAGPAGAAPAADAVPLAPFSARYEVLIDGKAQGLSELRLDRTGQGQWQLSLEANSTGGMARLAGLRSSQRSEFAERDGRLRLLRSEVRHRSRVGSRSVVTEFDWTHHSARFSGDLDRDQRGPLALAGQPGRAATRESLNLLLALSAAAAATGEVLRFDLFHRGERRDSQWQVLAPDVVEVPAGRFQATPVREHRGERVTTAWFSPSLPPLPLRVLRTDAGDPRYEIRLLDWQGDAAPSAAAAPAPRSG